MTNILLVKQVALMTISDWYLIEVEKRYLHKYTFIVSQSVVFRVVLVIFLLAIVLSVLQGLRPLIISLISSNFSYLSKPNANCGPSWSWSHSCWIYNYLYNQCLSSLKLWVRNQISGFLRIHRFPQPIKMTSSTDLK